MSSALGMKYTSSKTPLRGKGICPTIGLMSLSLSSRYHRQPYSKALSSGQLSGNMSALITVRKWTSSGGLDACGNLRFADLRLLLVTTSPPNLLRKRQPNAGVGFHDAQLISLVGCCLCVIQTGLADLKDEQKCACPVRQQT